MSFDVIWFTAAAYIQVMTKPSSLPCDPVIIVAQLPDWSRTTHLYCMQAKINRSHLFWLGYTTLKLSGPNGYVVN